MPCQILREASDLRIMSLKAMLFAEYTVSVNKEHAVIQRVNHIFERCLGLKCHFDHTFQNGVRILKRNFQALLHLTFNITSAKPRDRYVRNHFLLHDFGMSE